MKKTPVVDQLQRPLHDLRISVTDQCNFRCGYCMPAEIFDKDYPFLEKDELLSFPELIRMANLFANLGVEKLRITGGEPLLRRNISELIEQFTKIEGIEDIALTTNGSLLKKQAKSLKEAGLQRVNVSLDSLDDQLFGKMNGRGFKVAPVLAGIDAAADAGLEVKINMVVQKGVNDSQILPMARYFRERGHTLRFIEFMDVGNENGWRLEHVVPGKEIIESINEEASLVPLDPNYQGEVAKRYRYRQSDAEIGIITSVSEAFCSDCSRARMSADGQLYTCLFSGKGHELKAPMRAGENDEQLLDRIATIWGRRQDRYSEERLELMNKKGRKKVEMSRIGG